MRPRLSKPIPQPKTQYVAIRDLPSPGDRPRFNPQPKAQSRLQEQKVERKLTVVTERDFLKTVRDRDRMRCRKCGRKVIIILSRVPERAEVNHLHGRRGDLRFEDRCALLMCCECHEQCTGRVNEKWRVVGTAFIEIKGQSYIDARQPVTFERIA